MAFTSRGAWALGTAFSFSRASARRLFDSSFLRSAYKASGELSISRRSAVVKSQESAKLLKYERIAGIVFHLTKTNTHTNAQA